jgi:hypothetical protein
MCHYITVPSAETTLPTIHLHMFPDTFQLSQTMECLDTAIGQLFLEWNSCIGVPQDVWYVISTARIVCRTCRLVRSFDGDEAHHNQMGLCEDVGLGKGYIAIAGDRPY